MAQEMAEVRGRVMIRPWRVGLLVDTGSASQVRGAIADLSSVWGGASMPIFDINAPIEELEKAGQIFDVDSLYADVEDGPLAEFIRKPGWAWRGRGPWGPFRNEEEGRLRKGLLPTRALIKPAASLLIPTWDAAEPADLVLAGMWGLPDQCGFLLEKDGGASQGPRAICHTDLYSTRRAEDEIIGLVAATMQHVRAPAPRNANAVTNDGVHVLRPGHPRDVVAFWNSRAYGSNVIAVPAEGDADMVRSMLSGTFSSPLVRKPGADGVLDVVALERASADVAEAIQELAERDGFEIKPHSPRPEPPYLFQGLDTAITRSVRVDFRPNANWVDIELPAVPMFDGGNAYPFARGIVAAEVQLRGTRGQDPRFTGRIPPYRRHAALVEQQWFMENVYHARASHEGLVLGVDARTEEVRLPFAYNLDIMRLLFDDDSVTTGQSDVGKFQARAAEKFGGPFGGMFNQPGVRAAVTLAAGRPAGVSLPHLRNIVERYRGGWPDSVMESNLTPRDYATRTVNSLLHSGLFVPTLRVHCSHCRVESHVSADQLGSTMNCEFCGEAYYLALSHGLAQPEWRYRLAAHLRADQVEALLPALATTTLLAQILQPSEPPPVVLGLEIGVDGRKIEADVAAYLMDREWTAVLGEVKTGNRIDAKDIANLEFLREKLRAKDVRCLLVFATLKDEFSSEEITELRGLIGRAKHVRDVRGELVPNVPLVLTGPDLSRHSWDENHPWRWEKQRYAGIFETALLSCERNLGLRNFALSGRDNNDDYTFEWAN